MERRPDARRRLDRPVISIGNLSVGGTGKTPVVGAVARWLVEHGERPSVLSRGYGRIEPVPGVVVVSDGRAVLAPLARAGDEPLMLAHAVPEAIVCVSEDRYLAGVLAERRLGATVHVLDDGFQHLGLARDLDVLVTTLGEIPHGRVLPRGRLREPADAAARAHVLVVMGATAGAASAEAWTLGIGEALGARRVVGDPRRVGSVRHSLGEGGRIAGGTETGKGLPGNVVPPNSRVLLAAGIANPERFADDVRAAGWAVVGQQWFADHHQFTTGDVARIAALAAERGAEAVLTTAKDAVRFESLGSMPVPLYSVPLEVEFDPPTVLFDRIATVLPARQARRGPPAAEACAAPGAASPAAPTEGRRSPAGGSP